MVDRRYTIAREDKRLTEIQPLVVELINGLLCAPLDTLDARIQTALGRIGSFAQCDRAYVFCIEGDKAHNSHEWCGPGIAPMIAHLQDLPVEGFSTISTPLSRGEALNIPDINALTVDSPEYALLQSQGIRSLLLVPMTFEGDIFGFVGFDSTSSTGQFLPGEIYLLRSFGDVVMSVLLRRRTTLEMRRAEQALTDERAFLSSILSTSASGIVVLSQNGHIIFLNEATERILGADRADLLGQPIHNPDKGLRHPAEMSDHDLPYVSVLRSGKPVENCRMIVQGAENTRFASVNAAPISGPEAIRGKVVYALMDVTQQVLAEQSREVALAAAHRASAAKSNFLAKMSHEMRTPLNGVLGIADILAQSLSDPDQIRKLDTLRSSGNLLMGLINDLLDMTRIEAEALELTPAPFSLGALIRQTGDVHTLRASEKQLSFSVVSDDGCEGVRLGDSQRLAQILNNVISNAIKFTDTGNVDVRFATGQYGDLTIEVRDTGIGMSSEQIASVFNQFEQADSSTSRRFGGTGLGMSIVKHLVDLMGGSITVDSQVGMGTCVRIDLPLPLAESPLPSKTQAPDVTEFPRLRVLAADDNRTNQMILGIMLEQLGADVTMARDGVEALAAYQKSQFDLLILDISMPGMDGVSLLRAIRSLEDSIHQQPTPALAFTANATDHQVSEYITQGFDDCLIKPLKIERLKEAILDIMPNGKAA